MASGLYFLVKIISVVLDGLTFDPTSVLNNSQGVQALFEKTDKKFFLAIICIARLENLLSSVQIGVRPPQDTTAERRESPLQATTDRTPPN